MRSRACSGSLRNRASALARAQQFLLVIFDAPLVMSTRRKNILKSHMKHKIFETTHSTLVGTNQKQKDWGFMSFKIPESIFDGLTKKAHLTHKRCRTDSMHFACHGTGAIHHLVDSLLRQPLKVMKPQKKEKLKIDFDCDMSCGTHSMWQSTISS